MDSKKSPNIGDILNSRFELLQLLGQGAFASVWLALDHRNKQQCVLKIYLKDTPNAPLAQYREYLQTLQNKLEPFRLPAIRLPYEIGKFDGYVYEVSTYQEGFLSLDKVLSDSGPLHPRDALMVLSQIAKAIASLHKNGVVHADLKPANILISASVEREVKIIDFGMVQPIEAEEAVLVFGTYLYMHPELASSTQDKDKSTTARAELRATAVGPYIDLYAIGVIALELFTMNPQVPRPLSQTSITVKLKKGNPWLILAEDSKVGAVANLVKQLLTIRPSDDAGLASTIATLSNSLLSLFRQDIPRSVELVSPIISDTAQLKAIPEVKYAAYRIAHLGKQLAEETAAFILESGVIKSVADPKGDEEVIRKVNTVFWNAIRRARSSWRIGVAMTVIIFALLISMIVSAITLTVITGESQWAIIFGGVGVSTMIGTLIWRPYDRLFRATILIQQIEMIHIQTVAGFRGTLSVDERMRICRDAVEALKALSEPKEK